MPVGYVKEITAGTPDDLYQAVNDWFEANPLVRLVQIDWNTRSTATSGSGTTYFAILTYELTPDVGTSEVPAFGGLRLTGETYNFDNATATKITGWSDESPAAGGAVGMTVDPALGTCILDHDGDYFVSGIVQFTGLANTTDILAEVYSDGVATGVAGIFSNSNNMPNGQVCYQAFVRATADGREVDVRVTTTGNCDIVAADLTIFRIDET